MLYFFIMAFCVATIIYLLVRKEQKINSQESTKDFTSFVPRRPPALYQLNNNNKPTIRQKNKTNSNPTVEPTTTTTD